jgi:hypothetical protein
MINRITAPMKALMIAAIMPPPITMPICGNNQPAIKPPIMPTMIADQPVTAALDHHTGQPTSDGTDNQPNDECLYVHLSPRLLLAPAKSRGQPTDHNLVS